MATRSKRSTAPAPAQDRPAAAPWDWAADWGRQQAVVATESATTVFRGLEAMRRIQEEAVREASARLADAADRLRKPCSPAELMALQGELLRKDLEGATRYWQQLAGAALEMNTELVACCANLVDTEDVFAATSPRFLHS